MSRTRSKSGDKKSLDIPESIFEDQNEEMENEENIKLSQTVTIMIVKLPSLTRNGFGTRY